MKRTADPEVQIESEGDGYVIYHRSDGLRWKVTGLCDKRGDCVIGAVVISPEGKEVTIESKEQLNKLAAEWNRVGHIQTDEDLDVPTSPTYKGECCPFTIEVLNGN